MNPIEPRTQAAIDAALGHIATTASSAATRGVELLGGLLRSPSAAGERDTLRTAEGDLRRQLPVFCRSFDAALRLKVMQELQQRQDPRRPQTGLDWESLSLVDNDEVERRMFCDRIAQVIAHECDVELRELATYTGALLHLGSADQDRNPVRPDAVGTALFGAIEAVTPEREVQKLLARELAPVMAKGMRLCYAEIVSDLRGRGVQPVQLIVRGVEGPGSDRVVSGYASLPRADGAPTGFGTSQFAASGSGPSTRGGGLSATGPGAMHGGGAGSRSRSGSGTGGAHGASDAELMSLIRRLTFMTSQPGGFEGAQSVRDSTRSALAPMGPGGAATAQRGMTGPGSLGGGTGGLRGDGLTGLMAANLIRAHRDELRQASTGTLDHMVIDVVGSLFDQILSDPRVPPQMARQIARLQLPVLRVALSDPSFFSSRRHPVRRFVNRIASLACAFDDFEEGPGRQFLTRVSELVQEIIEGDFDQVEVYAAKLTLLEAFIAEQNASDVQSHGATATLVDGKESELRLQQRYMQQLSRALAPVAMDDYLRDFLSQVWSQALALVARRDGATAERTQRLRQAAKDLVMSVQPKGTPALRKAFLMQLPGLMKTLNEGLALVGWPQEAQKEFFGKLLPAHADSLKREPLTDLDRNLLAKQLEALFNMPLPESDRPMPGAVPPVLDDAVLLPQFSPEEVKRIGLVEEGAVDWDGTVDIDLSDDAGPTTSPGVAAADLDLGIDFGTPAASSPAEPPDPSHGPQLMDHLQVGFAYQMHLKDQWQKVRLSYVSEGRSFFVFTHGARHQETLSLTARMLARMCDTGRLRAFEKSYLLERATARARKQLAALKAAPAVQ